ncbi:hypothetical protein MPER_07375, partial [Moniliophthora perniciosa FA553]
MGFSTAILTSERGATHMEYYVMLLMESKAYYRASWGLLFLGEALSMYVILGKSFGDIHARSNFIDPRAPFCAMKHAPEFMSHYWIPILAYNVVVFLLIAAKGMEILASPHTRFALAQIPVVLALSLSITNASNLLLHLREAYYLQVGLEGGDNPRAKIVYVESERVDVRVEGTEMEEEVNTGMTEISIAF